MAGLRYAPTSLGSIYTCVLTTITGAAFFVIAKGIAYGLKEILRLTEIDDDIDTKSGKTAGETEAEECMCCSVTIAANFSTGTDQYSQQSALKHYKPSPTHLSPT